METKDGVAEYHYEEHENRGLVQYGPHSVQNRTDLAVWIAAIAAAWALVERELVLIYGYLMGKSLPRWGKTNLPMLHPVAIDVFGSVHGIKNRLDLLELMARREATDEEQKRIATFISPIRGAAIERNRIVHGLWGICEDARCADRLILFREPAEERGRMYREHDFKQAYTRLYDLQSELFALADAIHDRLHRA